MTTRIAAATSPSPIHTRRGGRGIRKSYRSKSKGGSPRPPGGSHGYLRISRGQAYARALSEPAADLDLGGAPTRFGSRSGPSWQRTQLTRQPTVHDGSDGRCERV